MLSQSKTASSVSPAALSKAMLEVFSAVRDKFTPNEHPHYEFSARELTEWMSGLQRYSLEGGLTLLQAIAHEGTRVFRDRLVGDHQEDFNRILVGTLSSLLGYKPDVSAWAWGAANRALEFWLLSRGTAVLPCVHIKNGNRSQKARPESPKRALGRHIVNGVWVAMVHPATQATVWYASTLGASAEERISGDLSKIKLLRWEADSFAELAAEKLKVGRCRLPGARGTWATPARSCTS